MKLKSLIFALVLINFVACNNPESNPESEAVEQEAPMADHAEEHHDDHMEAESTSVVSEEDIANFKSVSASVAEELIAAYLEIKEALVNTNGAQAKNVALQIQNNLPQTEDDAVSLIKEDLNHIADTESVEHQREHFNNLSKHIYALVKATNAADQTLYKQYCPMAFDNTGAFWLSSSEEIKNPYFGDKMLKCGRVEETLTK